MAYLVPTIHPAAVMRTGQPLPGFIAADLAKAARVAESGPDLEENILWVHPANPLGLDTCVEHAVAWMRCWREQGTWVAVDVETSGLDFWQCQLYSIALSGDDGHNVSVSFTLMDYHTLPGEMERRLVRELRGLLADPRVGKIYHNAPFDKAVLASKGFVIWGDTYDTQGAMHLIQPASPHKDLGWVRHTWLDTEPWKLNHEGAKLAFSRDPVELLIYNAKDAHRTMLLRQPTLRDIHGLGMDQKVISAQMAFADIATEMELRGLPVNLELRRRMGMKLLETAETCLRKLQDILSWPDFNPNAKDQVREVLFGKKYAGHPWNLGLQPTKLTPKDALPSTSYKAIIDHLEHPIVRLLVDYDDSSKIYATQYRETLDWEVHKLRELGRRGVVRDVERRIKKLEKNWKKPGAYQRAIGPDARLRPKLNPTGQRGSRVSTQPNCYDAETEVLTEHGWLPFPEAARREAKIIQYDLDLGALEPIQAPYMVVQSSRCITIETDKISVRVTPNHRMLVQQPFLYPEIVEARDLCHPHRPKGIQLGVPLAPVDFPDARRMRSWNDAALIPARAVHWERAQGETFYCATVPTGLLIVRRHGKAYICGNCQNQRSKDLPFFEAPSGRILVGIDHDQLELRIMSAYAGIQKLLAEFAQPDADPHTAIARQIFGERFDKASPADREKMRTMGKPVTYGSLYTAGEDTVYATIRENKHMDSRLRAALTRETVRFMYNNFHLQFPEIRKYHDYQYNHQIRNYGYQETDPLGRRRYYPVWPAPYKEASNWVVQSGGHDFLIVEMLDIQAELNRRFHGSAFLILDKHDELQVECDLKDGEEVARIMTERFNRSVLRTEYGEVRLTGEANVGRNLYESKKGKPIKPWWD